MNPETEEAGDTTPAELFYGELMGYPKNFQNNNPVDGKSSKYPVRPYKKPDLSKGPTPPIAPKEFREEPLDTGQKYLLAPEVGSPKRSGFYNRELGPSVDIWKTSPSRKDAELRRRDRENRMSPAQRVNRPKRLEREKDPSRMSTLELYERTKAALRESRLRKTREDRLQAESEAAEGRHQAFREKMESKK